MSKKQWFLASVLVVFTALTLYATYVAGLGGLIDGMTANIVAITLTVDLTIALSMVGVWMWNDAKSRGISALPYLVLMVFTGSVGSLLYLLRTARQPEIVATPSRLSVGGVAAK